MRFAHIFPALALLTACGTERDAETDVLDGVRSVRPPSVESQPGPIPEVADEYAAELSIDLSEMSVTPRGVRYRDVIVGTGAKAVPGHRVSVHYTGWLVDGRKFDSSKDSRIPFEFILGARMVIDGWDDGVVGMRVGGTRTLVIPPELGYPDGTGNVIPPGATLVFEVELLETGP